MPTVAQIHGMLLEEALLHLLRFSGYKPVTSHGADPTLRQGTAGLEVMGRGEHHQIDAIADFTIPQPFVNPARLLIEAKFKDSAVGIEIVRNAVGVLKDVSEYWVTPAAAGRGRAAARPRQQPLHPLRLQRIPRRRAAAPAATLPLPVCPAGVVRIHRERAAIRCGSRCVPHSIRAHRFFQPVMAAIRACVPNDGAVDRRRGVEMDIALSELRTRVRESLAHGGQINVDGAGDAALSAALATAIDAIRRVEYAVLAVALGRVPLVLTPAPDVNIRDVDGVVRVRIYWDADSWYLRRVGADGREEDLFSFDVPETLLAQYIDQHELSPRRAFNLKQEALSEIQALLVRDGQARLVRFVLDGEWLEQLKERLARD